jgi:arsenite-transporting ATPase
VDTAPTGHTLRLLRTPEMLAGIASLVDALLAKHRFLARSLGGRLRGDATEALATEIAAEARDLVALLADSRRASFTWVMLPEPLAWAETQDGLRELRAAGIHVAEVVVNQLTPPPPGPCALCSARRRAESDVLEELRRQGIRPRLVARQPEPPQGVDALRRFAGSRIAGMGARPGPISARASKDGPKASDLLSTLVPEGVELVLFGGKGGVGKTSAAAATALALARRDPQREILLLSVDPAHSLGDVLDLCLGDEETRGGLPGRLRARELDAPRALAALKAEHGLAVERLFGTSRPGVTVEPAFDREVVERLLELAPPGLDELMALAALARALGTPRERGAPDLVILDTAPTGHALRLLALPELARRWTRALLALLMEYRDVVGLEDLAPPLLELSRGLGELGRLLRDGRRTRFVAVTRAQALPRQETTRLLRDLARLRVPVGALLVNALTPPGCARCRRDAEREAREIASLRAARSTGSAHCTMVFADARAPAPRGAVALVRWSRSWRLSER